MYVESMSLYVYSYEVVVQCSGNVFIANISILELQHRLSNKSACGKGGGGVFDVIPTFICIPLLSWLSQRIYIHIHHVIASYAQSLRLPPTNAAVFVRKTLTHTYTLSRHTTSSTNRHKVRSDVLVYEHVRRGQTARHAVRLGCLQHPVRDVWRVGVPALE